MRSLHIGLAWAVIALNLFSGVWFCIAQWQQSFRRPVMFPVAYVGWGVTVLQVTVGVAALQGAANEAGGLHYFYGFLCMAAIGILYSYRAQVKNWEYLLYGLGNLFIMGLALRAAFLNPVM